MHSLFKSTHFGSLFLFFLLHFPTTPVNSTLFQDVSPNLIPDQLSSSAIAALGDFNNDKETDIFCLSPDLSSISLYIYSSSASSFVKYPRLHENSDTLHFEPEAGKISQIVASDYNADGHLDIAVTLLLANGTFQTLLYLQTPQDSSLVLLSSNPPIQSVFPPATLEVNGDLLADFFSVSLTTNSPTFWIASLLPGNLLIYHPIPMSLPPVQPLTFASFSSVAFTDMNGDCLADLILTTQNESYFHIHIFLNNVHSFSSLDHPQNPFFFPPAQPLEIPAKSVATLFTFADIDQDGDNDIIFGSQQGEVTLLLNLQKPTCLIGFHFEASACRDFDQLCSPDPFFRFSTPQIFPSPPL
eukprot:Sdes_comp19586_c1_seq1m11296